MNAAIEALEKELTKAEAELEKVKADTKYEIETRRPRKPNPRPRARRCRRAQGRDRRRHAEAPRGPRIMIRQKITALALAAALLLSLTGCGETVEQRIHDKKVCEAAGGRYVDGTTDAVGAGCDLSTKDGTK